MDAWSFEGISLLLAFAGFAWLISWSLRTEFVRLRRRNLFIRRAARQRGWQVAVADVGGAIKLEPAEGGWRLDEFVGPGHAAPWTLWKRRVDAAGEAALLPCRELEAARKRAAKKPDLVLRSGVPVGRLISGGAVVVPTEKKLVRRYEALGAPAVAQALLASSVQAALLRWPSKAGGHALAVWVSDGELKLRFGRRLRSVEEIERLISLGLVLAAGFSPPA